MAEGAGGEGEMKVAFADSGIPKNCFSFFPNQALQ